MRRGVALVTGATGGFGVHCCAALVARGFRVFAGMRELERRDAVTRAVAERGFDPEDPRNLECVALDLTDPASRAGIVARILDDPDAGAVDVLVNNAGTLCSGFAEELEDAPLREQFEINFFALVELTRALIPAMRERRHGRIINMSSIGGRFANPGYAGYHASKFALEGWSESLRYELRPFHVFVSLLEPGSFPTGIWDRNLRRHGEGIEGRGAYAKLGARLEQEGRRARERMRWAKPRVVGELVGDIALAEQPRLRYPIGLDAWGSYLAGPLVLRAAWEQAMIRWFAE